MHVYNFLSIRTVDDTGVVESDQYGAAAGINQMVNSLYALFGVGIATMVYWTFGVYGSILVNTLTFILSGILIQTISIPEKVRLPNGRTKWKEVNLKMLITEFKEGIRYIYQNETLKITFRIYRIWTIKWYFKRIYYLHIKIQISTSYV